MLCTLGGHFAATSREFKNIEELASMEAVRYETQSAYVYSCQSQKTKCDVMLLGLSFAYGTLGTAVYTGITFSAFVGAVHEVDRLAIYNFKQCWVNRAHISACPVPITKVSINNPYHD